MDFDFEWRTREEKLDVVRYWWREQRGICCICNDPEQPMEPYSQTAHSPWAASIEHLIPRRDNGPNTVGNVRLAHRWCNNVLGALWQINKNREEQNLPPLSEKWALSTGRGNLAAAAKCRDKSEKERAERAARGKIYRRAKANMPGATNGTMARLEMPLPRGATLPPEPAVPLVFQHSAYQPPRRLTGVELAQHLKTFAAKNGQKWPLA